MLTTAMKTPPPTIAWSRRKKSLHCLMLPPPPNHLHPEQPLSKGLHPRSPGPDQGCAATPLSPRSPAVPELRGAGDPQGRSCCPVRRQHWKAGAGMMLSRPTLQLSKPISSSSTTKGALCRDSLCSRLPGHPLANKVLIHFSPEKSGQGQGRCGGGLQPVSLFLSTGPQMRPGIH